jgi:membrane fusion protein (multidrug efflux system)
MKIAVRMLIMLAIVGVVLGGVFFFDGFRGKMIAQYMKKFASPTQTVATTTATEQTWHNTIEATGTLRAMQGAELSSDLSGIVDQINFKSGGDVAKGAVLLRLRSEDDAAKLQQLQSAANLAQTNYQRDLRQLSAQAVSRATVDTDRSTLRSAQAAVDAQQATIAKKTVLAPFAGHLGIREVDLGQYLAAGTAIVSLQALDPIFVDFYVQQQDVARITNGETVALSVEGYPGRAFTGTIQAVNAQIDSATRTLQVRAVVQNQDHALLPGMFATVEMTVGKPEQLITLPQTAISFDPYGSTVFVVKDKTVDGHRTQFVHQQFVQTSQTRGDQVAVTKGLKAGDVVVVAGQTKLRNGTTVDINNAVLPSNDPNPTPVEQ